LKNEVTRDRAEALHLYLQKQPETPAEENLAEKYRALEGSINGIFPDFLACASKKYLSKEKT
jgi:hypothetical protein